jgi:hypothetical protein
MHRPCHARKMRRGTRFSPFVRPKYENKNAERPAKIFQASK